eukprot:symbB.v1.2.002307.t1/scaffold107.1/size327550/23
MLHNLGPRSSSHCATLAQQLLDQGSRHITTAGHPSQLPMKFIDLQAPVTLGPPAFFPVGNAAGLGDGGASSFGTELWL